MPRGVFSAPGQAPGGSLCGYPCWAPAKPSLNRSVSAHSKQRLLKQRLLQQPVDSQRAPAAAAGVHSARTLEAGPPYLH